MRFAKKDPLREKDLTMPFLRNDSSAMRAVTRLMPNFAIISCSVGSLLPTGNSENSRSNSTRTFWYRGIICNMASWSRIGI